MPDQELGLYKILKRFTSMYNRLVHVSIYVVDTGWRRIWESFAHWKIKWLLKPHPLIGVAVLIFGPNSANTLSVWHVELITERTLNVG